MPSSIQHRTLLSSAILFTATAAGCAGPPAQRHDTPPRLRAVQPALNGPFAKLQSLDGVWTRDDGKRYLLCQQRGQLLDPGYFGCRLEARADSDELLFTLRFTSREDEREFSETEAKALSYDAKRDELKLSWGWMEFDDDGAVSERGTEERTLKRVRWLSDYETARLGAALAFHAQADEALRKGKRKEAWAHLVQAAVHDVNSAGEDSVVERERALRPRKPVAKRTTLEASSPR